jgi:hypothetical protein
METPEHQELRARQSVSRPAIIKTTLLAGFVFFIMSGGGPWSTAGTMNAIMGRDISLPFQWLLFWHFAVALFYVWIIARTIYQLALLPAIAAGLGVAMGLYVANLLVFYGLGFQQQSPEGRTLLLHIIFGLIASATYKAFAVPKPLRDS